MNKFLILLFLTFGLQTDWLSETKKLVSNADRIAVLTNSKVIDNKEGKSTTTKYSAGEIKKTKVEIVFSQLIDIELNFYEKNGFLFGEMTKGKDVLLYKRKRLENEPYATLIESRTYFKNETEGINLIRKVNIYELDKMEDVYKKLNTLDFETENLNADDFILLKEKFKRVVK